jgi:hypothetical protein
MALRIGFAAASILGVVTTFGTRLWLTAVVLLVGLVLGLLAAEMLPLVRRGRG